MIARAAALFLAIAAAPAIADDATIIVTGQPLPVAAGAAAYGSVTLDAARLGQDASGRLENALRDVAGFQQFRRTDSRAANPTTQGATLRGLGGNASTRALVLLDGVPVADPFGGYINWSALDAGTLAAARLTRGGGAGPFGAGAVAGTIELFSAGPGQLPLASASLGYGSRNSVTGSAGVSGAVGGGFASLSGRYDGGDGYILIPENQRGPADLPARYRQWNVSARGLIPAGDDAELQTRLLLFGDRRLRGLAGTLSDTSGADASLRLVGRGTLPYEALAYLQLRRFASGFASTSGPRLVATPTLDQYNTPATGAGGKLALRPWSSGRHELEIGVDYRFAAGETRERFRYQGGQFTRLRRAGGEQWTAGIYAETSWKLSPGLTLTGGARLDRWHLTPGHLDETDPATGLPTLTIDTPARSGWRPTARAGLLAQPTSWLALRSAAYLGWRLPTLNELYRPFRVGADATAANPALAPERLKGIEAGFDVTPLAAVHLGATVFVNRLDGAIGNVTLGTGPGNFPGVGFVAAGGAYRQRLNLDAITSRGVELSGDARLGAVTARLSYTHVDPRVAASGIAAAADGKRPSTTPLDQASASLGWAEGDSSASVTARYSGPQYDDDQNLRRLAGALTVDARLRLPVGHGVSIELSGENLFDALVPSGLSADGIIDRGQPRTVWLTLRWTGR